VFQVAESQSPHEVLSDASGRGGSSAGAESVVWMDPAGYSTRSARSGSLRSIQKAGEDLSGNSPRNAIAPP